MDPSPPTESATERLLSDQFGVAVSITASEHLAPWSVKRCQLSGGGEKGLPASVIVKWLRTHPQGLRTQLSQVHTEHAALDFLTGLGGGLAPELLAADDAAGILVLEDLPDSAPLYDLLARDAPLAGTGLSAFARTLAALHAATVGLENSYYERRRAFGAVDPLSEHERFLGHGWRKTPALVEAMLGVPLGVEVERDIALVLATLSDPGPFLAFSNGDAGPNNFMFDGVRGRLIDFEFAGYRHACADAVCLFVPGPAWITVVDAAASGLEAQYREVLCQAVPQAGDDRHFGLGIAAASLAYAIQRLNRLSFLDGRPPGQHSRVQRVAALEQAAAVADAHRSLPHLSGWAKRVTQALRRRWPDTDIDLSMSRYLPRW